MRAEIPCLKFSITNNNPFFNRKSRKCRNLCKAIVPGCFQRYGGCFSWKKSVSCRIGERSQFFTERFFGMMQFDGQWACFVSWISAEKRSNGSGENPLDLCFWKDTNAIRRRKQYLQGNGQAHPYPDDQSARSRACLRTWDWQWETAANQSANLCAAVGAYTLKDTAFYSAWNA